MNHAARWLVAVTVVASVVVLGVGVWLTRARWLAHLALPDGSRPEGLGGLMVLAPAAASVLVAAFLLGGLLPRLVRGLHRTGSAPDDVAELTRR